MATITRQRMTDKDAMPVVVYFRKTGHSVYRHEQDAKPTLYHGETDAVIARFETVEALEKAVPSHLPSAPCMDADGLYILTPNGACRIVES